MNFINFFLANLTGILDPFWWKKLKQRAGSAHLEIGWQKLDTSEAQARHTQEKKKRVRWRQHIEKKKWETKQGMWTKEKLGNSSVFFWFRRAPVRTYLSIPVEVCHCFHWFKHKKTFALSTKANRKAEWRSSKTRGTCLDAPPLFSFSFFYLRPNVGSFTREIFKGRMQTDLSIRKRAAKLYGSTVRKDLLWQIYRGIRFKSER